MMSQRRSAVFSLHNLRQPILIKEHPLFVLRLYDTVGVHYQHIQKMPE